MENFYQTRKDNTVYNQDIRRYDSNLDWSKQVENKTKLHPSMLYTGWGYSDHQQPIEKNYVSFAAKNVNMNKLEHPVDIKEADFERWVPISTEYDYTQRLNKPMPLYSNFGEEEKTHSISMHNSFVLDEQSMRGEYQLSEAKNNLEKINQISAIKLSNFSLENRLISSESAIKVSSEVKIYTTPVKMRWIDREEWKAYLVIKIQLKTDTNLHYSYWTIQLTDETNPLFLYTWDIGETEFHAIRQDQRVRVEFHKLAEYLGDLFELCSNGCNDSSASSYHACILSTDKSNIGVMTIEESTRFKDISLICLKFISSSGEEKLKFLSKQIMDFKSLNASQSEDISSKSLKIEELSQNYQKLKQDSMNSINEVDSLRLMISQLHQTIQEISNKNELNFKEAKEYKSELEVTSKRRNELEEIKLKIEAENRDMKNKIEILEHEKSSYKKDLDSLLKEVTNLRETRINNSSDLTEFKLKTEHMSSELRTLKDSNESKQKLIENQNYKIKQLEDELKIVKNNFAKQNSKLKQCATEINKGNEIISKHRKEHKELK